MIVNVALERLQHFIDNFNLDKIIVVILWTPHCSKCEPFRQRVENILKNSRQEFKDYYFVRTEVDDIPLFAPPGIPCMIFYYKGLKEFEIPGDFLEEKIYHLLSDFHNHWFTNIRQRYLSPTEQLERNNQ